MDITEIIKSRDFFENIKQKHKENTLSNVCLFYCDDEITASYVLILTALMIEYKTFELFNQNSAEFVLIQNNVDLDIKCYPKNKEKLLVADSNEIVNEAFIKPVNLPYKIFIINGIDVSTDEAQNKLLKILEEPPKNVYFLLSAKSEDRVLSTIKSRCDKIKIPPMAKAEMQKLSNNKLAIILANGHIGKLSKLEKFENLSSIVDLSLSLITSLKNSKQILSFSKKILEHRENLDLILEILAIALEDIIKIKCDRESLCKFDCYIEEFKEVEPEFSVEALCEISKLISNLKKKIEFNANLTVTIDNFLLKMLEVKYLCK